MEKKEIEKLEEECKKMFEEQKKMGNLTLEEQLEIHLKEIDRSSDKESTSN